MTNGAPPEPRLVDERAVGTGPTVGDASRPVARLRVLGVFEASVDGREVSLGGPRQRSVLARVLIGDGDTVSAEQIVEDVWGDRSGGSSTVSTVHVYVPAAAGARWGRDPAPRRRLRAGPAAGRGRRRSVRHRPHAGRCWRAATTRGAAAVLEAALARWTGPRLFGGLVDAPFLAIAGPAGGAADRGGETLADARARRGCAAGDVALLGSSRPTTRCASRWRCGWSPPCTQRAGRPTRWPPTSVPAGTGRAARRRSASRRCAGCTPRCWPGTAADDNRGGPRPAGQPAAAEQLVHRPAAQLAEIDGLLDDPERRPPAVALYGLAGAGKTELALEVAHHRHRNGRAALRVVADDPAGVAAGLADLAMAAGVTSRAR